MSCTRWIKDYLSGGSAVDGEHAGGVFQWVATRGEHEPLGELLVDGETEHGDSVDACVSVALVGDADIQDIPGRLCVCKHCKLVYFEAAS